MNNVLNVVYCWGITLCFCLPFTALGQTNDPFISRSVIPPSPNAANLGKYVDWPVNLYTGIPNIDIPLYELKGRGVSIPISLSYHASGNKVTDIASWVGLGWSLQCGGLITRSVRGLPDDEGSGYFQTRAEYNDPLDLSSGTIDPEMDSVYQFAAAQGCVDTQPDYYMLNALGKSYKLCFGRGDTIYTQPYSQLRIKADFLNKVWTVVLEDGTKLLFGGDSNFLEMNTNPRLGSCYGLSSIVSSWYLKSVTSSSGEVINFTYAVVGIKQSTSFFEVDNVSETGTSIRPGSKKTEEQDVGMPLVSTIDSDIERVEFIKNTSERLDLQGGYALSEIKVYSKLSEQYVRSFQFNHNYSQAVASNTSSAYPSPTHSYRLKLAELTEQSIDGGNKKVWSFGYNTKNLPSRRSYAMDHWGYFNGAIQNTTLLPYNVAFSPDQYAYGDRSPNATLMQAEMLTKITYPTGGHTAFEYEPNNVAESVDLFKDTTVLFNIYLTYDQSTFTNSRSSTFVLHGAQHVYISCEAYFSSNYRNNFGENVRLAYVEIKNASGEVIEFSGFKDNGTFSKHVFLEPGTYTFVMRSISGPEDFSNNLDNVSLSGQLAYTKFVGTQPFKIVGGLRIESISDFDPVTNQTLKRKFVYENPFVIHEASEEDYITRTIVQTAGYGGPNGVVCLIEGSATYKTRYSNSRFSLGDIQGGTVGYGKVSTLYGDNGLNGKTVSYFSHANDWGMSDAQEIPFPPVTVLDWRRGLLLEQHHYARGNVADPNAYIRIKKEKHHYDFVSRAIVKAYKTGFIKVFNGDCYAFQYLPQVLLRSFYTIQMEQVKKISSTEVLYAGSADSLIIVTNFFYDNPNNLQATRTETTDSRGNITKSIIRTPLEKLDINNATPLSASALIALDALVERNMISNTVQQEKYTGATLVERSLFNYKVWDDAIITPESVQVQVGDSPMETRLQFGDYDSYGNLLEQKKSDDVVQSYLYGYKNAYPIAEVTNARHSSVAYTSFEPDSNGGWNYTGNSVEDDTAPSGIKCYALAGGQIQRTGLSASTSYTLSFRYRSGTPSVSGATMTDIRTYEGVNGWMYYEAVASGALTLTIAGSGFIDELRLHPVNSRMTTYTYESGGRVTSMTDHNRITTSYEYDDLGRLIRIKDCHGDVLKAYQYHYKDSDE